MTTGLLVQTPRELCDWWEQRRGFYLTTVVSLRSPQEPQCPGFLPVVNMLNLLLLNISEQTTDTREKLPTTLTLSGLKHHKHEASLVVVSQCNCWLVFEAWKHLDPLMAVTHLSWFSRESRQIILDDREQKGPISALKGQFRLFEVGLYEVLTNGQCISFSGWRSPRFQFEKLGPVLTGSSAVKPGQNLSYTPK